MTNHYGVFYFPIAQLVTKYDLARVLNIKHACLGEGLARPDPSA